MKKPKVIVILGQTATGKSDFAVNTALRLRKLGHKAEIISADSRQVYRGLNLGTGKITKKEMRGVTHHMLDIASPKRIYTVFDYQKQARKILNDLLKKKIIPIICGGTGFYIDALLGNAEFPKVKPNLKLRKELSRKTKEELFKILSKLDKDRAKSIDKNNSVRLIRAIEIAKILGKVPDISTNKPDSPLDVLKIGLAIPDEILKKKIHTRLILRIKKGMLKEIENLHSPKQGFGLTWKRMEALGLEYRYGALYLQDKITKKEMIEKLNAEIWHYAKRQKTWFKRDKSIIWVDSTKLKAGDGRYLALRSRVLFEKLRF